MTHTLTAESLVVRDPLMLHRLHSRVRWSPMWEGMTSTQLVHRPPVTMITAGEQDQEPLGLGSATKPSSFCLPHPGSLKRDEAGAGRTLSYFS